MWRRSCKNKDEATEKQVQTIATERAGEDRRCWGRPLLSHPGRKYFNSDADNIKRANGTLNYHSKCFFTQGIFAFGNLYCSYSQKKYVQLVKGDSCCKIKNQLAFKVNTINEIDKISCQNNNPKKSYFLFQVQSSCLYIYYMYSTTIRRLEEVGSIFLQ